LLPPAPDKSHAGVVPAGSRRDQQQAYFIGGSEELQDMTYMAVPGGHKGSVLNKYGYKTQTSGNVKVGEHVLQDSQGRLSVCSAV
jgi:hypothetical protein